MERARVETLEYATATEGRPGAPLGAIVVATLVFAGANWVAALGSDYLYFTSRYTRTALEKLAVNMVVETFATAVAAAVVLCVQWGMWRVWRGSRSVWVVAAIAGVGYCAGMWGVHALGMMGVEAAQSFWTAAAAVVGGAAGAGVVMARWRGR
jgi:hypothetical protein